MWILMNPCVYNLLIPKPWQSGSDAEIHALGQLSSFRAIKIGYIQNDALRVLGNFVILRLYQFYLSE